jgi:glycosyltransferase involved in cell wall biosynthesis
MSAATDAVAGRRVVFVNRYFHPDISATSQMLTDLATSLAERGFEVHVICSAQLYGDAGARLARRDSVAGVNVHRIETTRFGRQQIGGRLVDYVSFYLGALRLLPTVLRPADILVVKTDPPLMSVPAAWLARRRGVRLVNWLQDVYPEVAIALGAARIPASLLAVLKRLRNWSLRCATVNVVIGERMRDHVIALGVDPGRIELIQNWSDAVRVWPLEPCESGMRRRLGLQQKFVVGYSGNLGRAHEIDTLVGAAELLRDRPGIVMLMVGGGALMAELRRQVQSRALASFLFLPYQQRESLADCLGAADVHLACLRPELEGLVVPSKFYGILSAARPVIFIGDQDAELARLIRVEHCGVAVRSGDAAALRDAIVLLHEQPELRWSMGRSARRLLLERYSRDCAVERWQRLLAA